MTTNSIAATFTEPVIVTCWPRCRCGSFHVVYVRCVYLGGTSACDLRGMVDSYYRCTSCSRRWRAAR